MSSGIQQLLQDARITARTMVQPSHPSCMRATGRPGHTLSVVQVCRDHHMGSACPAEHCSMRAGASPGVQWRAPLLLLERLSRTTLALAKLPYFWKDLVSTSSLTSLPRSPTKMRKSFSGHSSRLASHHFSPPAARGSAGGLAFFAPLLSLASFSSAACVSNTLDQTPSGFTASPQIRFEEGDMPWVAAQVSVIS